MGEHTRDREAREKREREYQAQKDARKRATMGTYLYEATKGRAGSGPALRLPRGGYVGLREATRLMKQAAQKIARDAEKK